MHKQLVSIADGQGRNSLPRVELVVAVTLASVLALLACVATLNLHNDTDPESPVARCDRLAQLFSNQTVGTPMGSTSPHWRRTRNKALEACLENPPAFERLIAAL